MKEQKPAEENQKLEDAVKLPQETPKTYLTQIQKLKSGPERIHGLDKIEPMTFTAFEIHKDLVDKEGFDPKTRRILCRS